MVTYNIVVTLTDAQDKQIKALATAIGVAPAEFLQRFWDGYTSDGVQVEGAVHAQVMQWIRDSLKSKLDTLDPADALNKLEV